MTPQKQAAQRGQAVQHPSRRERPTAGCFLQGVSQTALPFISRVASARLHVLARACAIRAKGRSRKKKKTHMRRQGLSTRGGRSGVVHVNKVTHRWQTSRRYKAVRRVLSRVKQRAPEEGDMFERVRKKPT